MNSFEGHPIIVTEQRYQDLVAKEKQLDSLLAAYPELKLTQKLTPTSKKYKEAFRAFVKRVDKVLSSEEIKGVFQMASIHGAHYKGESLAKDIIAAKQLLGEK